MACRNLNTNDAITMSEKVCNLNWYRSWLQSALNGHIQVAGFGAKPKRQWWFRQETFMCESTEWYALIDWLAYERWHSSQPNSFRREIAMQTLFESAIFREKHNSLTLTHCSWCEYILDEIFCRYTLRIAFGHRVEPNEANVRAQIRDENE